MPNESPLEVLAKRPPGKLPKPQPGTLRGIRGTLTPQPKKEPTKAPFPGGVRG